jgi:hypothetical protein
LLKKSLLNDSFTVILTPLFLQKERGKNLAKRVIIASLLSYGLRPTCPPLEGLPAASLWQAGILRGAGFFGRLQLPQNDVSFHNNKSNKYHPATDLRSFFN